jgi:uroporphyrinogen-III synthase
MAKILSTKILEDAVYERLLAAGHTLTQYNALEAETFPFSAAPYPVYVCSSQNAVAALKEYWHRQDQSTLQVAKWFCVGEKTAEALEGLGIQVTATAENATALIENYLKPLDTKILWFTGIRKTAALETFIREKGCDYMDCYMTHAVQKSFSQDFDAVLFFSPNGIESYLKSNNLQSTTLACSIGETTAEAAKAHTTNLLVSKKASSMHLAVEVINHFKKEL